MALFNWDTNYETGHAEIDKHHRHLVDLINQLDVAVNIHQESKLQTSLLEELIAYTQFHFQTEDRLMDSSGYSETSAHKHQHEQFIQRLADFCQEAGNRQQSQALLEFVVEWLSEHILDADKRMVASLMGKPFEQMTPPHANALASALKESEQRFRLVANSAPAPLWVSDKEGERTFVNEAMYSLLGCLEAELLGDEWRARLHPEDRANYLAKYDKAVNCGIPFQATYRVLTVTGDSRWIQEKVVPLRLPDEQPTGLIGVSMDISQVKQAEELQKSLNTRLRQEVHARTLELSERNEALQKTQQQLVQSEKMAAIGSLAAGVAHEINNPVGYVKSNISTLAAYANDLHSLLAHYSRLEADNEANNAAAELLREIKQEKKRINLEFLFEDLGDLIRESKEGLKRVEDIVRDLKDFSRADGGDWEYADLHQCLNSTLNVASSELKYKVDIVKQYGDIPHIDCLPNALCQVFMNILVNAAHATEGRGTITLRTFSSAGDTVTVEICDDGCGISPAIQEKIFNPFFTTKPVGSGTGLGLSVSYGIVEKHRGRLSVRSKEGEGTCFRVRLPVAR